LLNWDGIIWNDFSRGHRKVKFAQMLRNRRPRNIVALTASAGIAHRHDGRSEFPRLGCWKISH
jgi:hypothetical protein